eukprot:1179096-Prorocentrum_minimum.AAC.9
MESTAFFASINHINITQASNENRREAGGHELSYRVGRESPWGFGVERDAGKAISLATQVGISNPGIITVLNPQKRKGERERRAENASTQQHLMYFEQKAQENPSREMQKKQSSEASRLRIFSGKIPPRSADWMKETSLHHVIAVTST